MTTERAVPKARCCGGRAPIRHNVTLQIRALVAQLRSAQNRNSLLQRVDQR
jgi:hypothetical protein